MLFLPYVSNLNLCVNCEWLLSLHVYKNVTYRNFNYTFSIMVILAKIIDFICLDLCEAAVSAGLDSQFPKCMLVCCI